MSKPASSATTSKPASSTAISHFGLSLERRGELIRNAKALVEDGKGILAADESVPTAGKRLSSIGLDNTEENRRAYREILLSAARTPEKSDTN